MRIRYSTCVLLWIAMAAYAVGGDAIKYKKPVKLSELENDDITESSGLAASNFSNDRFWTHNDSGGKSHLYCFGRNGKHLGTCKVGNVKSKDWEDMASATIGGKPYLIVGDVGDNRRVRDDCMIYFIVEAPDPKADVKVRCKFAFSYAGGPVDCEGLAYDPITRSILLTEKTRLGSFSRGRVYEIVLPIDEIILGKQARRARKLLAKPIGSTAVPTVTAMDISRNGRFLVIGSYLESMLYERKPDQKWADVLKRGGKIVHMPTRRQGETICFSRNGYDLFATSEKRPTPFYEIKFDATKTGVNQRTFR